MTSAGDLFYDRYSVSASSEWMMRIGDADAPAILFIPALFEEMNRTRAFMAALMRMLARQGFGCWLPDLPGTGESERPLEQCGWDHWRDAIEAAERRIGRLACVVGLRGGCLLDASVPANAYLRFAPADGASLLRDLERASLAGGAEGAGYSLSPALAEALSEAVPAPLTPLRTVRLDSDPREADFKVSGPALWRRSEPASSAELVRAAGVHILEHLRACASS